MPILGVTFMRMLRSVVLEILHFHPHYDRDTIHPRHRPALGHLPPTRWLRPMLHKFYDLKGVDESERRSLSDAELQISNYQRRAPVAAVCIKRVAMVEEQSAKDPDALLLELDVGSGETVTASSIPFYARNLLRLAETGKDTLQAELDEEVAIAYS